MKFAALPLLLFAGAACADGAPAVLVLSDYDSFIVGADNSVEVLASRSRVEDANLVAAVRERLRAGGYGDVVTLQVAGSEAAAVTEHAALAGIVARSRAEADRFGGFKPKYDASTWSVGPGLAFLRERSGASTALIVRGGRAHPSANRIITQTLLSAATIAIGPVWILPAIGSGSSSVAVLVDLGTGKVRWSNEVRGSSADPENEQEARALVSELLKDLPRAEASR